MSLKIAAAILTTSANAIPIASVTKSSRSSTWFGSIWLHLTPTQQTKLYFSEKSDEQMHFRGYISNLQDTNT